MQLKYLLSNTFVVCIYFCFFKKKNKRVLYENQDMFYNGDDKVEIASIAKIEDELVKMTGRCLKFYQVKTLVMNGFHKFTINAVIQNKMRNLNIFTPC